MSKVKTYLPTAMRLLVVMAVILMVSLVHPANLQACTLPYGACTYSYECCTQACISGQCSYCDGIGYSCVTSATCCTGTCDYTNTCSNCTANGSSCFYNDSCCSGYCNWLGGFICYPPQY